MREWRIDLTESFAYLSGRAPRSSTSSFGGTASRKKVDQVIISDGDDITILGSRQLEFLWNNEFGFPETLRGSPPYSSRIVDYSAIRTRFVGIFGINGSDQ